MDYDLTEEIQEELEYFHIDEDLFCDWFEYVHPGNHLDEADSGHVMEFRENYVGKTSLENYLLEMTYADNNIPERILPYIDFEQMAVDSSSDFIEIDDHLFRNQ